MKTWQLVLVQLWVLCFIPAWVFILIFAPLVLSPPNPSWVAFFLLVSPPFITFIGCIVMWVARWKNNVRWQKIMVAALVIFPIVTVIPPFLWS